eukprot:SAG11_NODE_4919_length_1722_cov_1.612446_1_plen_26_part_10
MDRLSIGQLPKQLLLVNVTGHFVFGA